MEKELKRNAVEKMDHSIEALKKEFASVRTGRASLALLDGIKVDYYGTPTPLQQLASLSVPESRQIAIQPWEQKIISDIEKAIMKSDLGLTPTNDGKVIRINMPLLTEERRKQLVKVVKKNAEDAKVAVRNIRRDINDEIKKLEKEKHLSEDDTKKSLDEIQKFTDSYVKKIDEALAHKEKEIMEV
ncbi:MAG: ribosome recycling factor [Nitrospirae bacterium CG_4_10_14_3_um_filter_44_29]|nr:ribosome recycling factor [Nitrospirota bacterium]OIO28226.1 MAG: ribosome recycling factor [Nitrospirae bacterium CG1_02_44_142]PIP70154.1 MAG: ribosome recycling factor [Nitrospirae bacterium CG22_combo_CG10-13_8_21_14_all_44_11]PIV40321.1 MAG: ribosome recycling factor [Nitrospirae bacterium CG02_land_8_20_14_3_00_44_33]PIV66715.1 MAG: ribosome recycling factor [Nitrospirae bacterium CG01_land_8_20_14_3_00_44_22]PIW90223.1 MAG: ribosome recycling factor [Nitrospirae bacterium CG_4_8_14_3